MGFAGVHVAVLPTGRVLFLSWNQYQENEVNRGCGSSGIQIQDHSSFIFRTRISSAASIVFCRMAVCSSRAASPGIGFPGVGRGADHDIHTFDPASESWSKLQDMPNARWYPTCVTLADGTALIVGGLTGRFPAANNDEYETFDWQSNNLSDTRKFNPGFVG